MVRPKAALGSLLFVFFLLASSSAYSQDETPPGGRQAAAARPWIGVTIQDITEHTHGAEAGKGVLVSDVAKGGPAEEAGLTKGDIITKVNGRDVTDSEQFVSQIQSARPGDSVRLDVNRGGVSKTVNVKLSSMPAGGPMTGSMHPGMGGAMGGPGMMAGAPDCPATAGGAPGCPMMGGGAGCPMMGGGASASGGAGCPMMGGAMGGGTGCPMMGMGGGPGAGGAGCPMMGGMGGMMGGRDSGFYGKMYSSKVMKSLNLTDDQKKKLKSLRSEYQKTAIRHKSDIKVAEIELNDLMSDPVNLDKVRGKVNEISSKKAELRFLRLKSHEDLKKILTEEQRNKFMEALPGHSMGSGMGGYGGHGTGYGDGHPGGAFGTMGHPSSDDPMSEDPVLDSSEE